MILELNVNLSLDINGEEIAEKQARVKEAEKKKALKEYQPTHEEIWFLGYETHTGKRKPGIYQTKVTDADRRKLDQVREAIERNELGVGVDDMKKFSKSHALKLYPILLERNKSKMIKWMLENRPDNFICVQTFTQLRKMMEKLSREKIISIDTETTGLNIHGVLAPRSRIVGIVITLPSYDLHYYVPFGHTTGEQQIPEHIVLQALRPYIESETILKVLHNAKYDMHMFLNHGIRMGGFHFDTMVAFHLLNENEKSFALKNLANSYGRYFGYEDSSATYEELFGKGSFENTPLDIGSIYAAKDGLLTWKLYLFIMEQFDRLPELRKAYEEIERDITLVSVEMERNGFEVDFNYAEKYAKDLEYDLEMLDAELKRYFGDININSPLQLQTVLYDQIGLPDISKKRSTDATTLKKLAKQPDGKGCEILLQYRDLNKLLTTYIRPLPEKVGDDGRLHGAFKQSSTVTGRFSSSDPNLQNLPKKARKIITAAKGKLIIGLDFSSIEPRVLASMSGDRKFMNPFLIGEDLYATIGSQVFNVPVELCGDGSEYRAKAKLILLAVTYGMLPMSLAEMLKISVEDATKFIDDFFAAYPEVTAFMTEQNRLADTTGAVTMMFGRKRRFIGHKQVASGYHAMASNIQKKFGFIPTDLWGSTLPRKVKMDFWRFAKPYGKVKRMSVNAVIQGSAAEIMKIAMIHLYRYCLKMGYKFLATVHDEVLIEVPNTITRAELAELSRIMTSAVELKVPVLSDTEISERWGAGMSIDEWFTLRATGSVTRINPKTRIEEKYDTTLKEWIAA